jgi:hypothetical protein
LIREKKLNDIGDLFPAPTLLTSPTLSLSTIPTSTSVLDSNSNGESIIIDTELSSNTPTSTYVLDGDNGDGGSISIDMDLDRGVVEHRMDGSEVYIPLLLTSLLLLIM